MVEGGVEGQSGMETPRPASGVRRALSAQVTGEAHARMRIGQANSSSPAALICDKLGAYSRVWQHRADGTRVSYT